MKIAVKKINEEGIELIEKIPANLLNLDGFDLNFIDFIKVKGKFTKIYSEIISKVEITTHCEVICSRCRNQVCQTKDYSFQRSYQVNKLGNFLNIAEEIREEILLNFSLKALCTPDCKGLCLRCGRNLNWGKCNCLN